MTGERKEAVEEDDTVKRDAAPVLEVKNLVTRFDVRGGLFGRKVGAIHAVENVSFNLFQGETLALVGEFGLRQVDHRPLHHAACRAERRRCPARRL